MFTLCKYTNVNDPQLKLRSHFCFKNSRSFIITKVLFFSFSLITVKQTTGKWQECLLIMIYNEIGYDKYVKETTIRTHVQRISWLYKLQQHYKVIWRWKRSKTYRGQRFLTWDRRKKCDGVKDLWSDHNPPFLNLATVKKKQ